MGYTIRKTNWHAIMTDDDHTLLAGMLKIQIKNYYNFNILWKLNPIKQNMINRWKKRADYQSTLMVQDHIPMEDQESSQEEEEDDCCINHQLEDLNHKFDKYGSEVQNFVLDYQRQGEENLQLRQLLEDQIEQNHTLLELNKRLMNDRENDE